MADSDKGHREKESDVRGQEVLGEKSWEYWVRRVLLFGAGRTEKAWWKEGIRPCSYGREQHRIQGRNWKCTGQRQANTGWTHRTGRRSMWLKENG